MTPSVPLTRLFPRPRPVTLGGRTFLVGEMRLSDLAELSEWMERRWESPLEALRPSLDGLDGRARLDALRGIWDACEAGPPTWGTDEGMRMLATAEGIAQTFVTILRRHQPGMTLDEIQQVAEATTPEEYGEMLSAWRRVEPIDELSAMLGMDEGDRGRAIGWAQAVCELCEATGWTLDYALTLTLGQIRTFRGGGKPIERGVAVAPKTNLTERVREMRARMFGTGEVKEGGSDGG